jgi:hypothetical protein
MFCPSAERKEDMARAKKELKTKKTWCIVRADPEDSKKDKILERFDNMEDAWAKMLSSTDTFLRVEERTEEV